LVVFKKVKVGQRRWKTFNGTLNFLKGKEDTKQQFYAISFFS